MASPGHRDLPEEPGIWQQFRRRRVSRTVALYLASAYLLIEATLSLSTAVELPPWGFRAVVGVLVLGFPLTVVLAWTYDVTPKGIVKTPVDLGPEPGPSSGSNTAWAIVSVSAVLGGLILRLLRG